jgi:hypothetical protein
MSTKSGVVVHTCGPTSTQEAIGRKVSDCGWPQAKIRLYLKKNYSKKGLAVWLPS